MTNQISIRKVEQKDNIELAAIIRQTFIEFGAPRAGTVYSDPTTDNLFKLFKTPHSSLFVVQNNSKILGCCGIFPTNGLPTGCIEIVKFYICPEGRGKGHGSQLFLACESEAKKMGYTQLYIESTPEFSKAISLYEKLGFKLLSSPLGQTGHFGCNIWMTKNI